MPRRPRISLPGYYHVLNRGVNRDNIFLDDKDKGTFLAFLDLSRNIYQLTVHSYCILDNHYHLLLETTRDNLSLAVRYINSRYAAYFNKKMQRVGPLWQGRFKSWYVHDEEYFWLLLRYIEMNPVKAGLAAKIGDYPFSSAYAASRGQKTEILSASCLYQRDIQDWLRPLDDNDLQHLTDAQSANLEQRDNSVRVKEQTEISAYFKRDDRGGRNAAVYRAFMDGHKQTEIARFLKISPAAISRIIDAERSKKALFSEIRNKGLFWSYAPDIEYDSGKKSLLIETVLKYGDLEPLRQLFALFGKRDIKRIWEFRVKTDLRYKKLNYFLARIYFNLDIEASDLLEGNDARARTLRMLAAQNTRTA